MKLFTRMVIRCFVALVVALTLMASLAGIYRSTSYAAPLSADHAQVRSQNTAQLKPSGNGNAYINISIARLSGHTVTSSVNWGNGTWVGSDIVLYNGDGSRDDYSCWLNCTSGSTTFTHTYRSNVIAAYETVQLLIGGYVRATSSIWT